MSGDHERVIELSRTKILLLIGGSLLMTAASAWLFLASDAGSLIQTLERFARPWMVHGVGLIGIVFFGGCALYGVAKAFDHKPGLVLSAAGLVDNSSAVAAGFIPWTDVTGLDIFEFNGQRMLVVLVADPRKYVERGSALRRALNRANASMCGSPIVISSSTLKIPFEELHRELASRLSRHAGPIASGAEGEFRTHPVTSS